MKISITTIREFPDEYFEKWVAALNEFGPVALDGNKLLTEGEQEFESIAFLDRGKETKSKTVYKIIKGEPCRVICPTL